MVNFEDVIPGCTIRTFFDSRNKVLFDIGEMPDINNLPIGITIVNVEVIGKDKQLSGFLVDATQYGGGDIYSYSVSTYLDQNNKPLTDAGVLKKNSKIRLWYLASEYVIDIIGQSKQIEKEIEPTFCKICNERNDYGVTNSPDNTFTCFQCRQDPYRVSSLFMADEPDYY